jgi:hypothetical protein
MSIVQIPLFASDKPQTVGAGFHNIGSGVLRASDIKTIRKIERHYGERCGHIPLTAAYTRVLVEVPTVDICTQLEYLSRLYGRDITVLTFEECREERKKRPDETIVVVPYINVPETEACVCDDLGAETWGLPGKMTHMLKNKASFYALADEFPLDGFSTPDYKVSSMFTVAQDAYEFLKTIEELYSRAGLSQRYPAGVMLRASESDGNYGCCLVYEQGERIAVVPDGEAAQVWYYTDWYEALSVSQKHLASTMNPQKETRVVISRYIDFTDSPGMSVVIMEDQVESLGWNGQLQMEGSKACVGTSSYTPKSADLRRLQQEYEEQTKVFFEALLRKTAAKCDLAFASLRGVANIDIMIPSELEQELQRQRGQKPGHYLAECNPRWTNYTDAILAVLGASRREQTVATMRAVIQEGICTIDKYVLPEQLDPYAVREAVFERDAMLQREGIRIICRMTKNPMGMIFAGDLKRAQSEFANLVAELALKTA